MVSHRIQKLAIFSAFSLFTVCAVQANEMEKHAKSIIIPKISFDEVAPAEAFKLIRVQSKAEDATGRGVNFVFRLNNRPGSTFRKETLTANLKKISVYDLVRHICLATGLSYIMEPYAIVISDGGKKPMQTKTFPVKPGMIDAKQTRPRAKKIK
ncbi:MAG: hypothetical protein KAI66_17095 [Lentisphaeria bacterium]|nr:hypothetical protein [Lentisphaeria bacterium]